MYSLRHDYLSILAEGYGAGLHVQHAGDVVSLCVAGQRKRLLAVVV